MAAQTALLEAVAHAAGNFDIIHSHLDWLHLPLLSRLGVPFVTTVHGRLDLPGLPALVSNFSNAAFISISKSQREPLLNARWCGTVYHGLPPDLLRPNFVTGSYLAFLGRLTTEKGPEAAIRIARAAGMPLKIAAKLPRAQTRYFKEQLEPHIDGKDIEMIGEVNDEEKVQFLANAAALLFPIDWPEPFGLVMIEAMACGTPVIAFRSGSVPEIVDEGITGFVVDNEAGAVEAIRRLGELNPRVVREHFERRFTAQRMAKDYVRLYEGVTSSCPTVQSLRLNGELA
jgi:glycosyltransferase involved in cell wall biosynthesis